MRRPPSLDPVCVRSGDGILEVALVIHPQMLVAKLTVIETQKLALVILLSGGIYMQCFLFEVFVVLKFYLQMII